MVYPSRRWWFTAALVGFAAMAGAVLLATSLFQRPTPPIGRATASPSASGIGASPSPTAEPTPAPPPTLDLEWTEAAAFSPDGEGFEEVNDASAWANGIVAVGTRFDRPIPQSGELPPHGGRVWLSADGRAWEDVTPQQAFDGMRLQEVFEAADGSLIVIGEIDSSEDPWAHFWRSTDAHVWAEMRTDLDLPSHFIVRGLEQGPRGYLLLGFARSVGYELWFSADGLAWELVWNGSWEDDSREGIYGIAEGEDGFVAFGVMDRGWHDSNSFTLASTNGRDWVPPRKPLLAGVSYLARLRNAWIGIAPQRYGSTAVYLGEPETTVWTSANGLDWLQIGTMDFGPVELDGQPACDDSIEDLARAGGWLVVSVAFYCSYGDEEAQVEGRELPRISIDGITWQPLPFAAFAFDPAARETIDNGSTVRVAVATDAGLVLAGQSNGRATFWLGVPR